MKNEGGSYDDLIVYLAAKLIENKMPMKIENEVIAVDVFASISTTMLETPERFADCIIMFNKSNEDYDIIQFKEI